MTYAYTVLVEADSRDQASQVISERLDHDEDYGFQYTITYVAGTS